jgi:hypothetical protein
MKQMAVMLTVALAIGIALGMGGSQVLNAQQEPGTHKALLKMDLPGIAGKEFLVKLWSWPQWWLREALSPRNVFIYILEGAGLLEIEGKPAITQQARSMFHAPQQVQIFKNASQTAPGKLLVMFVSEKSQPLSVLAN